MHRDKQMKGEKISGLIAYPDDNILPTVDEIWRFCNYEKSEVKQNKLVKLIEEPIPFDRGLIKVDAKLAYQPNEDIIFESRPAIMYRMRRGLSFIMDKETFKKKVDASQLSLPKEDYKRPKKKKKKKKNEEKNKNEKKEDIKRENKEDNDGELMENMFNELKEDSEEDIKAQEIKEVSKEEVKETQPKDKTKMEPLEEKKELEEAKVKEKKEEVIKENEQIKVHKEEEKTKQSKRTLYIVRKGLYKFFDLDCRCFAPNFSLPHSDNKINYLLAPVQQHFLSSNKIQVIATRKANGENAQISYSKDFWCISSKNVSLYAKTEEDLKEYKDIPRYKYAEGIAGVWFKIVKRLESNGKLESLKQRILNHTMIGEYVGNIEHQHLVRYSKEAIVFYAIVDNEDVTDCLSPEDALNLFNEYSLDHVSYEFKGVYTSMPPLLEELKKIYIETVLETLDNAEEGLVLYIATKDLPKNYTISLCKIKTLEYRIYRKLRENIRNIKRAGDILESFKKNCTSMIRGILSCIRGVSNVLELLPMPFNYYLEVASITFSSVSNKEKAISHYTDFNGTYSY